MMTQGENIRKADSSIPATTSYAKIQHVDKSILRESCFDINYRKSYLKFKKKNNV